MQDTQETWVGSLGLEDPLEREWQPTPVFLPGKSHGQRSLEGYSPCGRKESDTTEATEHACRQSKLQQELRKERRVGWRGRNGLSLTTSSWLEGGMQGAATCGRNRERARLASFIPIETQGLPIILLPHQPGLDTPPFSSQTLTPSSRRVHWKTV